MLLKIQLLCCLVMLARAQQNTIEQQPAAEPLTDLHFETSHKRPDRENQFQTSHKIPRHTLLPDSDLDLLQGTMNLLPTKERPELNPVLSALINEDVMKSIEAKRAIEEKELEEIKAELREAERRQEVEEEVKLLTEKDANTYAVLTTAAPNNKKVALDDDFNVAFVDQSINLDAAGSENNKKSRIEIKKGPNGQDYEYEYVYYYEDEDDAKASETKADASERGKSRYTNIDRTTAAPAGNSLVSNKAKGRSSSIADSAADEVEAERLPANTRFPSRGKSAEAQPTPALDSLENAAEKKKISVKRPSLELVDSATFNTDEKQVKGIRSGDADTKSAIVIEQEQAAAAAAATAAQADAQKSSEEPQQRRQPTIGSAEESATVKDEDADVEQTTLSMQKAALDLYAILANENFNMDMTTDSDVGITTMLPDTTNPDDGAMTTLVDEAPSSTTSTTTTTTTEATTTTTTTTTTTPAPGPASLFGGKRAGLNGPGRNRYKLNKGGKSEGSTTTTTEAPASEAPKTGKNRFSRPSIGGRSRPGARTTTAAPAPSEDEEEVSAPKEVKPVSSGFGRGRPRNRFNLRSTTTTEKPANSDDGADANEDAAVSSTTTRSLRGGRPTLGLRGRSRTTTAKPSTDEEHKEDEASANGGEEKPAAAPAKPASRFARPGGANRLLPRGKLARTTEAPATDDSTADSSHHNDVKGDEEGGEEHADKPQGNHAANHGGLNRLKTRPHLHKTENSKPKVAPAPVAPRKVNPLLAKRRLALGHSTTETPADEDNSTAVDETKTEEESAPAGVSADAPTGDDADKHDGGDEAESTTKQQARGLGLLTQRRRLPLRKPGTIL